MNPNGCPIGMTFFIYQEYNDFTLTHSLYHKRQEIATHSMSWVSRQFSNVFFFKFGVNWLTEILFVYLANRHRTPQELWAAKSANEWVDEIGGMKDALAKFANIPKAPIRVSLKDQAEVLLLLEINVIFFLFFEWIKGFTGSVLADQRRSNVFSYEDTQHVLRFFFTNYRFCWPSSLALHLGSRISTRKSKIVSPSPMIEFIQTAFSFPMQDCLIPPCPSNKFPGIWTVPVVTNTQLVSLASTLTMAHFSFQNGRSLWRTKALDATPWKPVHSNNPFVPHKLT